MKKRRFYAPAVHHIYQKAEEGFVIMYSNFDYLVLTTLVMSLSKKYGIIILAFSPMVEHFHMALEAVNQNLMSRYMQEVTSKYAIEYNYSLHRVKGHVFPIRYGCAPKRDSKSIRSLIAYVANNAPERKLCLRAVEYRWNLLAYAGNSHPFSEKIDTRRCSNRMKKAIKEIKAFRENDGYLGYTTLKRLFKGLNAVEQEQLTDLILHLWCSIDFERASEFFGGMDKMLEAFNVTKGKEFDLKEEWDGYSDRIYDEMKTILSNATELNHIKEIQLQSMEKRQQLFLYLRKMDCFNPRQIAKYLHLKKDEIPK